MWSIVLSANSALLLKKLHLNNKLMFDTFINVFTKLVFSNVNLKAKVTYKILLGYNWQQKTHFSVLTEIYNVGYTCFWWSYELSIILLLAN